MNKSPAEVLRAAILAQQPAEWPVYATSMPDKPDQLIVVYDTTPKTFGRYMSTGETVEHPGVQIRVRAATYLLGYQKAKSIARFLDAIARSAIAMDDGYVYTIQAASHRGVIAMGQEEGTRRDHFSINATLSFASIALAGD